MERALVVQKFWLDKIFDENKIWEMRSNPTSVRGKIGLIESGSGMIVGECHIIASPHRPINPNDEHFDKHKVEDVELLKKWKYPWIIFNAKRYEKPIPYTHPKGAVVWVKL